MASRMAKPDGLLVVEPERELAFLHALPVERLWGIGPATAAKLHAHGLRTIGEVAQVSASALRRSSGKAAGRYVHAVAHNRDPRRVRAGRRRRSIGAQRALGRRPRSPAALDAIVVGLVDRLARRLRTGRRACRTVVLRLRFGDYSRATRSHTLAEATTQTQTILATARGLLAAALPAIERQGLTLVGLSLTNLDDDRAIQLALPLERRRAGALDAALDDVRERFGATAITRAVLLNRDRGISMPHLPD